MFLLLLTIPAMLLAIAIATVPLLVTMAADRRLAHEVASPAPTAALTTAETRDEDTLEPAA